MTPATPAHLPRRLTMSLWDFSWYTQTMPGEPFDDLDRAFSEASVLQRGAAPPILARCGLAADVESPHHGGLA